MARSVFRGYNRVKFQSTKLGRTVFCQSLLLRDYLIHLEWDEEVKSYELKPFKIEYKLAGGHRTFRPHLLVNYTNNRQIVVWLKSSIINQEEHHCFEKLISEICERNNYEFRVRTAEEVRQQPLFTNLKFLRRYLRTESNFNHTVLCREFFDNDSNPQLGDLLQFFKDRNEDLQAAYALLSRKIIQADLQSTPLDLNTRLKLIKKFPNFQNGRITA